jgi:hypothetical protein
MVLLFAFDFLYVPFPTGEISSVQILYMLLTFLSCNTTRVTQSDLVSEHTKTHTYRTLGG